LKKGFSPEAAKQFVESYRDTVALANLKEKPYTAEEAAKNKGRDFFGNILGMQTPPPAENKIEISSISLAVPFKGAELKVRVELQGESLLPDHLERVREYLELAKKDLESS